MRNSIELGANCGAKDISELPAHYLLLIPNQLLSERIFSENFIIRFLKMDENILATDEVNANLS